VVVVVEQVIFQVLYQMVQVYLVVQVVGVEDLVQEQELVVMVILLQ